MLIALWLGPALVLAAGMLAAPSLSRQFWFWCFGAAVVVHLIFVAISPDEFRLREFGIAAGLLAVAPWLIVAGLFSVSGFPRRRIVVSFALPFVWALAYFGAWSSGLAMGVLHK